MTVRTVPGTGFVAVPLASIDSFETAADCTDLDLLAVDLEGEAGKFVDFPAGCSQTVSYFLVRRMQPHHLKLHQTPRLRLKSKVDLCSAKQEVDSQYCRFVQEVEGTLPSAALIAGHPVESRLSEDPHLCDAPGSRGVSDIACLV